MVAKLSTEQAAWDLLQKVLDPEVPALSIVELGIVRSVEISGREISVTLTPTYSGCPAMDSIHSAVRAELQNGGWETVKILTQLSPAWTTDWMSEESKEKLRQYGIAPPVGIASDQLVPLPTLAAKIPCPFCQGIHTELRSKFGATACKSLYYCRSCEQPFEYFKSF